MASQTDWQRVQFDRSDVEIVEDNCVYQGFFQLRSVKLRHRLYRGQWSRTLSRELFVRGSAVGVLLYDPWLDSVAFVEQFRVGGLDYRQSPERQHQSPWLWELVAGIIDKDEAIEDVAIREAREETGSLIQTLAPIADYYSSPGGSDEYFYLFADKADLSQVNGIHGLAEEGEDIRVHVVSVEDAWHKMLHGQLNNAHTLIAMQWLKLNHERIRSIWQT